MAQHPEKRKRSIAVCSECGNVSFDGFNFGRVEGGLQCLACGATGPFEYVPALVAERLAEALREMQRRAKNSTRRNNPLVLEMIDMARAALEAYPGDST